MLRLPFVDDWTVRSETAPEATAVTLPHDAMLFEQRDPETPNAHHTGFYPGGVYRYEKRFLAPEVWRDSTVLVEFEGVYMRSDVYLNGHHIGGRPSGYAQFRVELGKHLLFGEENVLEVVANNPSGPNSRWYSGSGIYRPVHLMVGGPLHLSPDGVRLQTLSVEGSTATLQVDVSLVNSGDAAREGTVRVLLLEPGGSTAAEATFHPTFVPAAGNSRANATIVVPDAKLWSVETPFLYEVRVELSDSETIIDEWAGEFGIRTISADARKGFQLNGVTMKLRGACIHHDNGVIGAHTLYAAEERRVRILKESGYNAIRSSHNPISRAMLQACDRLGMLVMDELADEWWRAKTRDGYSKDFDEWWRADLESMVLRDLNHASVVMYSIGNEIAEVGTPRGEKLGYEMVNVIRQIDPSRLVTNGVNYLLTFMAPLEEPEVAEEKKDDPKKGKEPDPEKLIAVLNLVMGMFEKVTPLLMRLPRAEKRTYHAQKALDVAGYNYGHDRWKIDTRKHPERVIVGTETFPSTTAKLWGLIDAMPNVLGEFVWTAWDYVGEAGLATQQYNQPRRLSQPYPALLAGEPIIDITGYRQPWSYYTEIIWGLRTEPYLAVRPLNHAGEKATKNNWRPTDAVHSWSWPGYEGVKAVVEIYARAARVELLRNGQLVGQKSLTEKDLFRVQIPVEYHPGTLIAIAYDDDGKEMGRSVLRTAGPELQLRVLAESSQIIADGADLLYLNIELTDAAGVVHTLADRMVTVEVEGAILLGAGSAQPTTTEALSAARHTTYQGRALAVIRSTQTPGPVTISVSAEGLTSTSVQVECRSATADRCLPEQTG